MIYRVSHKSTYVYSEPVSLAHNEVRLTPRDSENQTSRMSRLTVEPLPTAAARRIDWFGNHVTSFTLQDRHEKLVVAAAGEVEVIPPSLPEPEATAPWETVRDGLPVNRTRAGLDAYQFVFDSTYVQAGPEAAAYAAPSFPAGRPLLSAVIDLSNRMSSDFKRDRTATHAHTHVREVFRDRRGVCQDFAQVMIACLRSQGLAARYVSGYLLTKPPPGRVRLAGADASHAWLSVWCPPHGWIDSDPFNNLLPSDQHITLAWGRDYDDISPVRGVIVGGGRHTLTVGVDVEPLDEASGLE